MTSDEICSKAISCVDINVTVPATSTNYESLNHTININQTAMVMGILYELMSFKRTFSISGRDSGGSGITSIVRMPNGDIGCGDSSSSTASGSVSEDCVQTLIIPMYLNLSDRLFIYEKRIEKIQFVSSVHPHKAVFRQKFGNAAFWKYVIRKESNEYLQIEQEFHVVQDGIDTLLHTANQYKNPFNGGQRLATWGLYGTEVVKLNDENYDPDIRQILVYPIPPSLGIPIDLCGAACSPSINNYGFYDYNSIEGGFIQSSLAAEDGGKDFYYPYWLRQMTANPIMREWADKRYAKVFLHEGVSDGDWIPPTPTTYNWPFGSFVKDSQGNYIYSAIFTDINNESFLYNKCSPLDIFEKITTVSGVENTLYCPITLISGISGLNEESGIGINYDDFTDDNGQTITDDSGVDVYA